MQLQSGGIRALSGSIVVLQYPGIRGGARADALIYSKLASAFHPLTPTLRHDGPRRFDLTSLTASAALNMIIILRYFAVHLETG